ncbi:alpha-L-rhamnosidase C-terminal domain-containing protein [Pseudomonas sp. PMCC200344]|uniref:alpha-L-rhamnosidase-related protein n=1 Tax=Pseudomonas sp. PMCC200344 TaxID=3042028 RepID=UPI0024B3BF93|nr:alpha-L-rhamnosidase C-terminal domain-containing protein [Pseudomonas sp. PMCC200344]
MKLFVKFFFAFFCLSASAAEQPRPIGIEGSVVLSKVSPIDLKFSENKITVDYGKVYFSKVTINPNSENIGNTVTIKLRESSEPDPLPSTGPEKIGVRYLSQEIILGKSPQDVPLPESDKRLMPASIGAVMPFRYIDIYGWKGEFSEKFLNVEFARSSKYKKQGTTSFSGGSTAEELNKILELSNHTIEATSFAGVFIDGDRERLPYEADAYINMLGWFANVNDLSVPRRTFEFLVEHPSWPTEWQAHMIFMAWADYLQSGDVDFLRKHYKWLKTISLAEGVSDTGMVDVTKFSESLKTKLKVTYPLGDLVDWPPSQRDGHEMLANNTVTNAFIYKGFVRMADIARVLGEDADNKMFKKLSGNLKAAMDSKVKGSNGTYVDGIGSNHTSALSLFIPLAFGMVDSGQRDTVVEKLNSKVQEYGGGFPSSVFTAQYLLEALFESEADDLALSLMLNKTQRGWMNMINKYDATITHEAWDVQFKDNEDWTHAWGAAPANIIPRFILGVSPSAPGWDRWQIKPSRVLQFSAKSTIPTPHGVISIVFDYPNRKITFTVPKGTIAELVTGGKAQQFKQGNHEAVWGVE